MARVPPRDRDALPELEDVFEARIEAAGYVPVSMLILGRRPPIARAVHQLLDAAYLTGEVSPDLKALVALVTSTAIGCRYCQAHSALRGGRKGVQAEKLQTVWDFETSPLFDDGERAALRLARDAVQIPNAVTDQHFEDLRAHFAEAEIVELVTVVALFSFLSCWNSTMATDIESDPLSFALDHLPEWEPGRHAPASGGG